MTVYCYVICSVNRSYAIHSLVLCHVTVNPDSFWSTVNVYFVYLFTSLNTPVKSPSNKEIDCCQTCEHLACSYVYTGQMNSFNADKYQRRLK